ncbi:hypothetical protein SHELI_v1c11210 [Spiroplasma helicoides]|uniref:Uncharacterized protein n=1 Tax=Spiroplasma helicoides TaxID=216938 RepID=A0A1B3SMA6_9MOLU|nr:hypothetical protein [Spiroplasma helicoides]AOG61068.1 hypothetical protein SHELI_v1c11210 [Spiroplasma helicoides]
MIDNSQIIKKYELDEFIDFDKIHVKADHLDQKTKNKAYILIALNVFILIAFFVLIWVNSLFIDFKTKMVLIIKVQWFFMH